ncbi:MAG: hypothetical protein Q9169_008638, partial [Polycauliona sp. 2 TL-2023]
MLGEILVTVEKLKWTIQHGEKALRPERRPTNFLMMYKHNEVRWEPLGVLAACVSWNYPFHNALSPIISTLFTGSAILVKSSEQTAFSANYFTSIARHALSACGHSPHLVQSLVCWPQTANHLTSHPGISHITFIGSKPIAHIVCASAAKALIPVCVELGGKDPAVLLDSISDYDLKHKVVPILMKGIFTSSGQNCIGIERIIACPRSYERLIPLLEKQIQGLRLGSAIPCQTTNEATSTNNNQNIDIGAMISPATFQHLESLIRSAISLGATLRAGTGTQYIHPTYPQGHYFAPTLLTNIDSTMPIASTELFAPIALLMPASSPAHAISIANSTPYALGASVFGYPSSSSFSKQTRAQAQSDIDLCLRNIKAGMISLNDFGAYYAVSLPFGGRGGSGYGRFGGQE